ncbi:MAG: anti-sigma factor [Solirubrobacterales bacterium]|nr:anti-sigma factor [Solirubrobacterales bacterium]
MMDQMNENLHDDAAAFVLGAMSELEHEAFRVKVMRDCELGRYVESLEQVGDHLLMSSPPVAVPESIGASIIAEAQRDLDAREILESPRGVPTRKRSGFGSRAFRPLALALSLLVVGLGAFAMGGGFGTADQSSAALAANFDAPTAPTMNGEVKASGDGAAVNVSGMDTDIEGDVYQLWIQRKGTIYAAPVFTVASDGSGHAFINRELAPGDVVMITREPAGGSKEPTSKPLASAQV